MSASHDAEMNLGILLMKNVNGFGEDNEFRLPVVETLTERISRDGVQKFVDLIWKK